MVVVIVVIAAAAARATNIIICIYGIAFSAEDIIIKRLYVMMDLTTAASPLVRGEAVLRV